MKVKTKVETGFGSPDAGNITAVLNKLMGAGPKPLPPPSDGLMKIMSTVPKKGTDLPEVPAKGCEKKRKSKRSDLSEHFVGEPWESLSGSEHHLPGLAFLSSGGTAEEMPAIPALYYGHGGDELKKALRDPELRRDAIADVLAGQAVENILISQVCGGVLGTLDNKNMINEISIGKGYFQEIFNLKSRADQNARYALESLSRMQSLTYSNVLVKGAGQVNIGPVQQVQNRGDCGCQQSPEGRADSDIDAGSTKNALQKRNRT